MISHSRTFSVVRLSALAAAIVTLSTAIYAAPQPPALRQDNSERFDKIWRTTRDNFYDAGMKGLDWKQIGERYRERALSAKTPSEFQAVIDQMLGELHASHNGYFTDNDLEFYLLQSLFQNDLRGIQVDHIGVTGVREPSGFLVKAIMEGGPAANAGVKVGDRIVSANGAPFTTVGSFRGRGGQTSTLSVKRQNQGKLQLDVTPVKENPQRAFLNATNRSVHIIERSGKRLGYIHLWTMTNDLFKEALDNALLTRLANTDGLILDLRDGFGGHPNGFTDILFRPDVEWGQTGHNGRRSTNHTGYSKPMVLLINEGTRSAKEWFSYQIKKASRGLLVGKTTAGAFLGAGGFQMGSDGYLELPIVDLTVDGKRLEGVGVSPDVIVEAEDTYGPNDGQLRRSEELLLDRLKRGKSELTENSNLARVARPVH
jgi:carboxyl-terminal processing protease